MARFKQTEDDDACVAARLVPDTAGANCGRAALYLPETSSTQDVCRDLLRAGARAGTVVMAGAQRAGRGSQGRVWQGAAGAGVHLSVLAPLPAAPEAVPWLTPLAAIATAQALRGLSTAPPRLKWPNDVLLGDKKVAGVLTEIPAGSALAIVGIGVNVHAAPQELPDATFLDAWADSRADRQTVARRLLQELDHLLSTLGRERLDHIKEAWRLLLDTVGRRVTVELVGEQRHGLARAVDGSGALLVRTEDGGTIRVVAGSGSLVRHVCER